MAKEKIVEIVRSYSRKLSDGNYGSRDFFCSRKEECFESEAVDVSRRSYEFCKAEVAKDMKEWTALMSKRERAEKAGFEVRDEVEQ